MWGTGAKGEEGWFCAMKCCCMESEHPTQPSLAPASSCLWTRGQRNTNAWVHGCFPFCSQPACLPSHLGLPHPIPYPSPAVAPAQAE